MVGGEVGLIDGKAAQAVYRAVRSQHGNGQQDRALRGARQGQQRGRPAVAVNGGGGGIQMLGKAGEIRKPEFLRPLSVGHHMILPPGAGHAPVEQQIAAHAGRVAALEEQTAAEVIAAQRGVQHHKRAGAVCLLDVLTQRIQHGSLQTLCGVRIPARRRQIRRLFLHDGGHVLGEVDAHDGNVPPQRCHIRGEGLHAEIQRCDQLLAGAFQLIEEKQTRHQRCRQNESQSDHIKRQPLLHGAADIMKFRKRGSRHDPYPPKIVG